MYIPLSPEAAAQLRAQAKAARRDPRGQAQHMLETAIAKAAARQEKGQKGAPGGGR
jgi:hypothetical protein